MHQHRNVRAQPVADDGGVHEPLARRLCDDAGRDGLGVQGQPARTQLCEGGCELHRPDAGCAPIRAGWGPLQAGERELQGCDDDVEGLAIAVDGRESATDAVPGSGEGNDGLGRVLGR